MESRKLSIASQLSTGFVTFSSSHLSDHGGSLLLGSGSPEEDANGILLGSSPMFGNDLMEVLNSNGSFNEQEYATWGGDIDLEPAIPDPKARHRRGASFSLRDAFEKEKIFDGISPRLYEKIQKLIGELQQKEDDFARAVEIGEDLHHENEELKFQMESLKMSQEQTSNQQATMKAHIASVENKLDILESENQELKKKNIALTDENARLDHKHSSLLERTDTITQEEVNRIQSEMHKKSSRTRQSLLEERSRDRQAFEDMKEDYKGMREEILRFQNIDDQITTLREENTRLNMELEQAQISAEQEEAHFRQTLADVIIRNTQLERDLDGMQELMETYQDELTTMRTEREVVSTPTGGLENVFNFVSAEEMEEEMERQREEFEMQIEYEKQRIAEKMQQKLEGKFQQMRKAYINQMKKRRVSRIAGHPEVSDSMRRTELKEAIQELVGDDTLVEKFVDMKIEDEKRLHQERKERMEEMIRSQVREKEQAMRSALEKEMELQQKQFEEEMAKVRAEKLDALNMSADAKVLMEAEFKERMEEQRKAMKAQMEEEMAENAAKLKEKDEQMQLAMQEALKKHQADLESEAAASARTKAEMEALMAEKERSLQAQYQVEMNNQKQVAQLEKEAFLMDMKKKMDENEKELREAQDAELKTQLQKQMEMERNSTLRDKEVANLMEKDEQLKKEFEMQREEMMKKLQEKDAELEKLAMEQEQAQLRQAELEKARIRQEEEAQRKHAELEREWQMQKAETLRKQKELEELKDMTSAQLEKQRAEAEQKQRELEREQAEARKAREALKSQREEARKKNEELEAERAAARKRDEELEKQRREAMELQEKLEIEKQESKMRQEQLEREANLTKSELAAQRKQALEKQQEIDRQQQDALKLQAELKKKHEEARRNRELLDQQTQEAKKNRQLLEAKNAEAEAKQKQLDKEKAENLRREREIEKLQKQKPKVIVKELSAAVQTSVIKEADDETSDRRDSSGGDNLSAAEYDSAREMRFRDTNKRKMPRKKRAESFQATESRADSNLRHNVMRERMKKIETRNTAKRGDPTSPNKRPANSNRNTPRKFPATYSFSNRNQSNSVISDRGRGASRSMAVSGRLETKNIIDNYMGRQASRSKAKSPKVRREIPLVELEYLNLTATAIFMKYSRRGDPYNQLNLTSQELVQAAQNLPFYNIYDFMCDYVESRRRRFEEQASYLELADNPVFKTGMEVLWQERSGGTITGEIIRVYKNTTTRTLMLSVSDGRRRHEVRASEASVVHRNNRKQKSFFAKIFGRRY